MSEVSFGVAFREAGGVRRRQPVPYPITYEYVRKMCEKREHLLRIQFQPDERFDPEDEAILASLSLDDPTECWMRWDYLKGLWHAWERGFRRAPDADQKLASWQLQYREPVWVIINGRKIAITSRSRAAMVRLARHEAARALLAERLKEIAVRKSETRRWRARRALDRLAARCEREWEHHSRGILANALSPDGRAALPDEAPDWWDTVAIEDESRILDALIEAGPRRFERATKRRTESAKPAGEDHGFGAPLRMWEARFRAPPMEWEDKDLAQLLHSLDIGHPGSASNEVEDAFAA